MSQEDPKPLEAVFAAEEASNPHLASIIGNEVSCSCKWKREVNGADAVELYEAHLAALTEARESAVVEVIDECEPYRFSDVFEWLEYGQAQGWVSAIHCATHDVIPVSVKGEKAWDEGYDPCEHIVRLWPEDDGPAQRFVIAEDQG